jgi:hypothetical protein
MVLYADDTSIIITDTDKLDFEINLNQTFRHIYLWFNDNILTLNFQKTQYLKFRCMNYCNSVTQNDYDEKSITNATETKFLGLCFMILCPGNSIRNRLSKNYPLHVM